LCLLSRQPPGNSPGDKGGKNRGGRGFKKQVFEAYMSQDDVSRGLKRGELLQVPLEGRREGGREAGWLDRGSAFSNTFTLYIGWI